MKHIYLKKLKFLTLTFSFLFSSTLVAQNFELQLLHYSDVDGNEESALDAVDEFSALVDFFKTQPAYVNNTLVVTSGDLIIPGPRFYAAENSAVRSLSGSNEPGHVDIAFANAFGVDVASFGNHEFDQGPGELFDAAFSSESFGGVTFPGSEFPWLSTNIDFTADGDFSGVIGTDGDDISNLNSQVAKYAVTTVNGETIGIVGAVAPSFPDITSIGSLLIAPAPGSSVAQIASEIQPSVDALKAAGVNKIILLAHMQAISIEKQLASLLDGVDIIVAGGSNTRMGDSNDVLFSNSLVTDTAFDETYPFQSTDAAGDPVLVVNVDGDYKYLGRLVVEFDSNGVIDLTSLDDTINGAYASNASLVSSLGATPIQEVVDLRDAVQGVISAQYNNVVGFSSVYLDGRRSQVRTQETNLGNLTADANLWYANLLNPAADAGVDISLKNGGGLRTEIGSAVLPGGSNDPNDIVFSPPANNGVSEGHLRATLRFDNGLVRLTLTADELVTIIEHGLAEVAPGAEPGRFPQVGGMNFVYDPTQPAGSRLVDLVVDKGDNDPTNDVVVVDNGVNVAPMGTTFNMVTLNFLANGGDSYPFASLSNPNRINYYNGLGFGETVDFPDGDLANDPAFNSTFSYTGGEQDAMAEYMSTFHPDNASAYNIAETPADQDTRIVLLSQSNLVVTEIFSGQSGDDLTADWFEITNTGSSAWVSGVDSDLFYDDDSSDASTADLIQGLTDIQPGESVVVLVTGDPLDVNTFQNVWAQVLDLTNVEVGYTDGSGLGGGGDAVTLWLGDPLSTSPIDVATYPDTGNNDGQSYDVELMAFSTVGNANGAVATLLGGGNNADVPNIGSPGNAPALTPSIDLVVTEIFSGQSGDDLTADWFEIKNLGGLAWVSGVDPDLFYDDDSSDPTAADLIQGLTDIQPGESVVVLVTSDQADVTSFITIWSEVLDLSNVEVGFTDGSGLGGGGDAVTLWLGDPLTTSPVDVASYPDTGNNDGQSFDVELIAFSTVGNANGAVATLQGGGNNADVPNIASPGDAPGVTPVSDLKVTEIFSGQAGTDLTADWFEIKNTGNTAWVSGVDPDLFYDDDSSDASAADLIQGITDIQPGEAVIVLVSNDTNDITTFINVWSAVLDLSNVEVGFTDGSGLGGGGDAVTLWLGDPLSTSPIDFATYPDTANNDGQSYDVDLMAFSTVGNANGAVATLQGGGDNNDVPNIASPGDAINASQSQIVFDDAVASVVENAGSIVVTLNISQAPANDASVQVAVNTASTAVEGTHFNFTTTTVTFLAGSSTSQDLNIPIIDNASDDSDLFFMLQLSNPLNASIGNDKTSVYILDDDTVVPAGNSSAVDANYLTSYLVDPSGTAEIGAYDPVNQYLFVTNGDKVEVLDFSDVNNISPVTTLQQASFGGVQSVAVDGNLVAVAYSAQTKTDPGAVFFYELPALTNVTSVTVGALPDMLTFTPDGTKVLVANEGEPSDDYTIDPEGSVSIIDVSGGFAGISQSSVTDINFNGFDSDLTTLLNAGVRIFGPGASVSQDLEPEYIAVSEDGLTAYVVLQENNAYARIDLTTNTVTAINAFALKDHSLPENSLDTSDETDFIFNASWPIFGLLMPDGMDSFNIGGVNYLITANEGDARDWGGYAEERNIGDADYMLDPTIFPDADILGLDANLGALTLTVASGDTDGDGDFDEIHAFGGRSFSIYEADSGNFVYDSGNDFEVITAADPTYGAIFNASNSNNSFKNRSDNKGPEPEAVIVEEFNGNYYAFILLERIGGVMIYDVTDPNAPVFLQYVNNRDAVEGGNESGDLGPEGVILIKANESPNGIPLLVVTNEVSATLSIYSLDNTSLNLKEFDYNAGFTMYPNPARNEVFFNIIDDYDLYDLAGRLVKTVKQTRTLQLEGLQAGMYLVTNSNKETIKLVTE
jgi:2',3'-cyclic-nucleotide 2'-phosphodiesterase (5'-nucleotidase family)/cell division septation protein DedD